jgi:hypothetical protein
MRGKDYNTGLRGVLFEARHYQRMGAAVWLYGWLVLRQTHQHGTVGCVLGGSPVSYREIEEETGFRRRTLECWMRVLRRQGYIETEAAPAGVIVRITKAKKFPQGVRKSAAPLHKFAESVRKVAEGCTQNRVANHRDPNSNHQVAGRIGSSSVVGFIERESPTKIPNRSHTQIHKPEEARGHNEDQTQNPSCLSTKQNQGQNPPQHSAAYQQYLFVREARARLQLLRAEREEAVRRELAVGTGPEVHRS